MRFLEAQLELQQEAFDVTPSVLPRAERTVYVMLNAFHLEHELHEALDAAHHGGMQARDMGREMSLDDTEVRIKFVRELVDAYHLLGNLFLAAGVDDDELEQLYHRKRAVNAERQRG